jgi:hypothetical protein
VIDDTPIGGADRLARLDRLGLLAGACSYCAQAFGAKDKIELSRVKLLREYEGHPSLQTFASDGCQALTF